MRLANWRATILSIVLTGVLAGALLLSACGVVAFTGNQATPTSQNGDAASLTNASTAAAASTSSTADQTVSTSPAPVATDALLRLPDIASLVEKVTPAVVSIVVQSVTTDFFRQAVPQRGAGSGVIISPDGYIVTNNHVVEGAKDIKVTLPDGRDFSATLGGRDPLSDLAVVKVDASDLPVLRFGDSTKLRVGEFVVAIGNALDLDGGPTVTLGVVSAKGRSIDVQTNVTLYDLIQTDAAINPGNSGGPLINLNGEVVGINTATDSQGQNIGFSISTPTIKPIVDDLMQRGKVVRSQLGVSGQTVTPLIADRFSLAVKSGVLLTAVGRGSSADQAGLRQGDVIVAFNGAQVKNMPQLQYSIWRNPVGATVEITYYRGGDKLATKSVLQERPSGS